MCVCVCVWVCVLQTDVTDLPGSKDRTASTPQPDCFTASQMQLMSMPDMRNAGAPWWQQRDSGRKPWTSSLSYPSLWASCSSVSSLAMPDTPMCTTNYTHTRTNRINHSINQSTNQCISEWMNEWISEWVSEWVNEWMNEWMNQSINSQYTLLSLSITNISAAM